MNHVVTILKRVLVIAALLLAVVYLADFVSVRYRIPRSRDPYGAVTIQRYYAVTMKNRKTEFYFDQPTLQTCVRSLFPHLGYLPCWYLNRRKVQRVEM